MRKLSVLACFSVLLTVFVAVSNCYCAPGFEKPIKAEASHCSHHVPGTESAGQDCGPRYQTDDIEKLAGLNRPLHSLAQGLHFDQAVFGSSVIASVGTERFLDPFPASSPPAYILFRSILI